MIDKEMEEGHKQFLRDIIASPLWDWVRRQYLMKQNKKLEYLLSNSLKNDISAINITAGEIKGFKDCFDLIEGLSREGVKE